MASGSKEKSTHKNIVSTRKSQPATHQRQTPAKRKALIGSNKARNFMSISICIWLIGHVASSNLTKMWQKRLTYVEHEKILLLAACLALRLAVMGVVMDFDASNGAAL